MRATRFLKRLINPDSDRDAGDASTKVRHVETVKTGAVGKSSGQVVESGSADKRVVDSDRSSSMFASEEEPREAGIDPAELFGDDTDQDRKPDAEQKAGTQSQDQDTPELISEPDDAESPVQFGEISEAEVTDEELIADSAVAAGTEYSASENAIDSEDTAESDLAEGESVSDQLSTTNSESPEPTSAPANAADQKSALERERMLARSAVSAGFVITLATELRTPISSLRVSFDLLKDPEAIRNNPEESKRLVGNIERSIAKLERQASDLLEIGYINTGSLSLIKQPLNMSEPILASMDISRSTAAFRQVAIELEMEPDLPRVMADGFRITQIMNHLLSNSIKFTPVGESVLISISSGIVDSSGVADLSGKSEQENEDAGTESLIVRVIDHGLGIRKVHFERIFEPFYRISGEGIGSGAGVGLGLAIVKGLIELHSGHVWVRSTPREITEFGFSIPLT